MSVKRLALLVLGTAYAFTLWASKGESSRVLVHTLNYIGSDYKYAVTNGTVTSEIEYKEMVDFSSSAIKYFHAFSPAWSDTDSVLISKLVYRLDTLVKAKASFEKISAVASEARNKILEVTGLVVIPAKYPSIENGKIIYRTACEKCHGAGGKGDGPEGVGLEPQPRNFHDDERMKTISPFFAFNAVRLGVEGTGMKAHPQLSDEEVWDVAFYVMSLRYQKFSTHPFLKSQQAKTVLDSVSLPKTASLTDEELAATLKATDSLQSQLQLAVLRLNQPRITESEFIQSSLKYLEGAMELYRSGKHAEAAQLTALSYLEGIEPIEMQLKASDPDLMYRLEAQMQNLRKMMENNNSLAEVNDSLRAVKLSIDQANELLSEKQYSFVLAFMLAASVLLREGLEAFLVIMVILSVLKATHLKNSTWWVHAGWITAVIVGVALWFVGGSILRSQMQHIELIEGIISFVAVAMLLYVGFWLHGKSEANKWKEYVSHLMRGMVSKESMIGLAGLSFFVVFREVFESVLFLSAMNIESGGTQAQAIGLGVLAAFVLVLVMAFVVLRYSTRLPIPKLFKISSFVMGVLAVILAGKGIHSFQEVGKVSIYGVPFFRVELFGIFPTAESLGVQLLVLAIVVAIWKLTISGKKK